MEKEKFYSILREMRLVCNQVNDELKRENPNSKVVYEVFQLSDLYKDWDSMYKLAEFYNENWTGNVDFMHIPDLQQTIENCRNYPIIIAREEGKDEILGVSTIKYDENTADVIDPYFPEKDAKYFSITGILTRKNNPHRGIGKKIYEIALRGAHNYERYYPGTRIMCVIDCRNRQSLRALATAVDNIRNNGVVGEGAELPANISGYYELRDKQTNALVEAPTLVMEVGLQAKQVAEASAPRTISYENQEGVPLFDSLLGTLRGRLNKYGIGNPIINEDGDCGIVHFYSLQDRKKCQLSGITINSNGTEKGNDRIPRKRTDIPTFMNTMRRISMEEETR